MKIKRFVEWTIAATLLVATVLLVRRSLRETATPPPVRTANLVNPSFQSALALPSTLSQKPMTSTEPAKPAPSPAPLFPVLARTDSALGRFQAWAQSYRDAPADDRANLEAEGVRLATERRAEFKTLIVSDPREALRQAVPMVARQQLPPSVLDLLEERVNGRGVLRTYLSYPTSETTKQPAILRYAEFDNGQTYEARVYGRRAESTRWTANASLNGVVLDGQFAVHESPLRVLEFGEIPSSDKTAVKVCPVSGKTSEATPTSAPITEATPAVEAYGQIIYLCDGSHVVLYEEQLIQGEGATGGPQRFTGILPAAPSPSLGQLRVLYIPLTFADQNQVPATEAASYAVMKDVSDFFYKASFGRLTCLPTVTPPVKVPHNEAWYKQKDSSDGFSKEIDGLGLEHQHAREEARKLGYDSADFDAVVVRLNGGPRVAGGWGGGSSVWIYSESASIVAHELGHTFGLSHANFWDTGGASAIGPGSNQEYGNPYDVMGGGPFPKNHYNAQAKNQVKWLPDDFVQTVTESGLYRVYAFDQTTLDPTQRYALKIAKDGQRTYWGEVRALFDNDNKWVANGLLLGWKWPSNSGGNIQLIDTTPGSPGAKNDAAIVVGQTFSDFESGIHLTTLAVNNEPSGARSMDVMVALGDFPSNQPPTLALTVSAANIPIGTPVTFTAAANDPDGDTLAYQWLSSNNTSATTSILGSNAPSFTRSFGSPGKYVVTCVASDMKGGSATRYQLVTVGNGNAQFSISGRITLNGQGLPRVYVSTGGNNAVLTDSDGYYTIPNLSAGTYTVSPQLYGCTFTDLFNNSVLVGPNFSGADFDADFTPRVTLTASAPAAKEAGLVPGTFTLSRTGPDADPLAVKILGMAGTASSADYALRPIPVTGSPYNTVTIPGGQSSLDIVVTPVDDSAAEGPETVLMQLGLDPAYVISGPATATVVIDDNDTALPKVSITAQTVAALENPARASRFTITRSGSAGASLTVNLTYSGTASNGIDYAALPLSVLIPAGASFANLSVSPLDDRVSEVFETVVATLATSASYVRDPLALSATVLMVDDDLQTVSLEVADSSTAETDLTQPGATPNPATFIVTRAGDLAQPLTVYYALSGTALHGVDYEALPGSVIIPAGQDRASVVITPRFDGLGEGPETVTVQLAAGGSNYKLGSASSGTITMTDAEDLPYVEVIPMTSAREPSTAGKFRFTLKGSVAGTVTIRYTIGGAAEPGVDYTSLSGTVTLNSSGANNIADVTVTPINDALAEDLETITVTIERSPDYQTWEATRSATLWLFDDDQPTVFVDAHTTAANGLATIAENSTSTAKFYLSRTGSTTSSLRVNYTMAGTALNRIDYQALPETVTIPAGAPGVDIAVRPIQDTTFEGTETITLSLASGDYGRGPDATIYLTDDEASTLRASFATVGSVASESAGTVNIPVILSAASPNAVTVEYEVLSLGTSTTAASIANTGMPYWLRLTRTGEVFRAYHSTNGGSWTQIGTATTMALANSVWLGLAVCSRTDGTLASATFDNVSLSPDTGRDFAGRDVGFVSALGSVNENAGVYTVTGSGLDIGGSQDEFHYAAQEVDGNFTFTARVAASNGGNTNRLAGLMVREDLRNSARHLLVAQQGTARTQFFYRTNSTTTAQGTGVDYQFTSGILTFPPGSTSENISLMLTDDSLAERNEQIVLTLRNAHGAILGASQHVLVIGDNDAAPLQPSVGFAAAASSYSEEGTPVVLVSLSQPVTRPVSVDYSVTGGTALAPEDYSLPAGTLTFAPGETAKVLPLTLMDDNAVEPAENVQISLSNSSGATLTTSSHHTLTIRDNDLPVVTLVATGNGASEAGDTGRWTFTRAGDTSSALNVNFTVSGTALGDIDYAPLGTEITIPAGAADTILTLTPLPDSRVEGPETVIVTLAGGTGYAIGLPNSSTLTIVDADISTVTIAATSPSALESGPTPGTFTLTRTEPISNSLTVSFAVTGTGTSGSDYSGIGTSAVIPVGQTSVNVTVNPINDSITEGPDYVVVSLNTSANYLVGLPNFASVTIADNDSPPALFISQPAAKAVRLAAGQGLNLQAIGTDDGAPDPLRYTWTKFSGPGSVTFGSSSSAATTALFSTNGLYILRISVTDGQFTVSDDVTVQVGAFAPADWVDVSLGSPSTRGKSGQNDGVFTVVGPGTGFTGTTDSAHFVGRQVNGTSSVTARVTSLNGTTANALAGVMLRESNYRGARRVLLGVKTNGVVELRSRSTRDAADTSATGGTSAFPVWLKLERNGNAVTASKAPDIGGAPGTWTRVGSVVTLSSLRADLDAGIAASNGSNNTLATATFDHLELTPEPAGPAVVSEDLGSTSLVGNSSLNGSAYTLNGGGSLGDGGHFRFQQYVGDVTVTARLLSHTATGMSAKGGVMIRDTSLDNAPVGMMGIAHYWGGFFVWRNVIGGSGSSSYGGSAANPQWIRLVRKGNTLSAWKAPNASGGGPGVWTQQGVSQVFNADAPIYVGLAADSAWSSILNTVQFDNLSVVPGNLAPAVDAGPGGTILAGTTSTSATVADDGKPNSPGVTVYQWSKLSGPGFVTFKDATALNTTVTFSGSGTYILRLTADDGEVSVFNDVTYQVSGGPAAVTPFESWQAQHFAGGGGNPIASETSDPDLDGLVNLVEFALGTDPNKPSVSPITASLTPQDNDKFIRITVTKNADAIDLRYAVEWTSELGNAANWSSIGIVIEQNTAASLVARDSTPISTLAAKFYRVTVSKP